MEFKEYLLISEESGGLLKIDQCSTLSNVAFVRNLSLEIIKDYESSFDVNLGFTGYGNNLSKLMKSKFPSVGTLTENRRSLPYKMTRFFREETKTVLMFGDVLGKSLVDNAFPRIDELYDYVSEFNMLFTARKSVEVIFIVVSELDGITVKPEPFGRNKLLYYDIQSKISR